jgi:DNA-directed RNA polymerase I subunit RPA2
VIPRVLDQITHRVSLSWEDYLNLKVVEFADTNEMIDSVIAPSIEECKFKFLSKGQAYERYCVLRPGNAYSEVLNLAPYLTNTPAARTAFKAQQLGQGISIPRLSFLKYDREKLLKYLTYPQSPLVATRMSEIVGSSSEYANGYNAIMAIIQCTGRDIEDSIIVCAQSVQLGLGHSVHRFGETLSCTNEAQFKAPVQLDYRSRNISAETYTESRKIGKSTVKFNNIAGVIKPGQGPNMVDAGVEGSGLTIKIPEDPGDIFPSNKRNKYMEVNDRGLYQYSRKSKGYVDLIHLNKTKVNRGDVLITRITGHDVEEVTYGMHREGYVVKVDSYKSHTSRDTEFTRYVCVEEYHIVEPGDKWCSRDSQKGLGDEWNRWDMPFVMETGMVPDIIFNPHGLPTRQTPSMYHEMLTSVIASSPDNRRKVGIFTGDFYIRKKEWSNMIAACKFRDIKGKDLDKMLMQYFSATKIEQFMNDDIKVPYSALPDETTPDVTDIPSKQCYTYLMKDTIIPTCDIKDEDLKAEHRKVEKRIRELCYAEPGKEVDFDEILELCSLMGLGSGCSELMAMGTTGEPIEGRVFMGGRYYLNQKHLVENKINYRNEKGKRHLLTRQPLPGRGDDKSIGAGNKSGSMELQAYIGQGIVLFIQERTMKESDQHTAYICIDCKLFAIHKKSGVCYCQHCGRTSYDAVIGKVKIPFALVVEYFLELSVGRTIRLDTKIIEKAKHVTEVTEKTASKFKDRVKFNLVGEVVDDDLDDSDTTENVAIVLHSKIEDTSYNLIVDGDPELV